MYDFGEFRAEGPVMTFCADGTWLCVRLEQMDSIAQPEQLCPVPLAGSEHVGLLDRGDSLIPVMSLTPADTRADATAEPLVAVLQVRGESVGLLIDRAGRVEERYWFEEGTASPPAGLDGLQPRHLMTAEQPLWLIDADQLWPATDEMRSREASSDDHPGPTTFKD